MVIRTLLLALMLALPATASAEETPQIGPSPQSSGGTLQPTGSETLQPQSAPSVSAPSASGLQSSADGETVRQWLAGDTIGAPQGAPEDETTESSWTRDATLAGAGIILLLGLLWFSRGLMEKPVASKE